MSLNPLVSPITPERLEQLLTEVAEGIDHYSIIMTHWPLVARAVEAELNRLWTEALSRQVPVAAEVRFKGESQWGKCSVEHHNHVTAHPQEWPGLETRALYSAPIIQQDSSAAPSPEPNPAQIVAVQRMLDTRITDQQAKEIARAVLAAAPQPSEFNPFAGHVTAVTKQTAYGEATAYFPEMPESPVDVEALRHCANEWADMATNGLQWVRNIVDGTSKPQDALENLERNLRHCQEVNNSPKVQAAVRVAQKGEQND